MQLTSPHGVGALLALVLLVLAIGWTWKGPPQQRGRRLAVVLVALALLALLALFGSGSVGSRQRVFNVLGSGGLRAPGAEQVAQVIRELTAPSYIAYVERMNRARGSSGGCAPKALGELESEIIDYAAARELGFRMRPPPADEIPILLIRHANTSNAGLVWLGLRDVRLCDGYVQEVFARHVDVHLAVQQLDHPEPEAVRAALALLASESHTAPEWVLARLPRALRHEQLAADLAQTRGVLEAVVQEPERRGMPPGTRVPLGGA